MYPYWFTYRQPLSVPFRRLLFTRRLSLLPSLVSFRFQKYATPPLLSAAISCSEKVGFSSVTVKVLVNVPRPASSVP